jgi:hypothetical protein
MAEWSRGEAATAGFKLEAAVAQCNATGDSTPIKSDAGGYKRFIFTVMGASFSPSLDIASLLDYFDFAPSCRFAMPKNTYQYDSSRVYRALEDARTAVRKRHQEDPRPGAPFSDQGRVIRRVVGRETLPTLPKPDGPRRRNFCPPCESVMLCTGYTTKVFSDPDDGPKKEIDQMYAHLPREAMKNNAAAGCSLCRLLLGELRQRIPDGEVGAKEWNHVGYDFCTYLGRGATDNKDGAFAVLFMEYTEHGPRTDLVLNLFDVSDGKDVHGLRLRTGCSHASRHRVCPFAVMRATYYGGGNHGRKGLAADMRRRPQLQKGRREVVGFGYQPQVRAGAAR